MTIAGKLTSALGPSRGDCAHCAMIEPVFDWLRSSQRSAAQRERRRRAGSRSCRPATRSRSRSEALELVATFPGARREVGAGAGRGAAASIDARLEPIIAQLDAAIHDELPEEHGRRVAAVARGVRPREGLHRRLQRGAARPAFRAPRTSAGARSCRGCSCASRTTRVSTASSGCFATATGFPRSGATSTSSTSSRACAAGSASSSCSARRVLASPASRSSRST